MTPLDSLAAQVYAGVVQFETEPSVRELEQMARSYAPLLGAEEVRCVAETVRRRLVGFGALQALLEEASVTEVMVQGNDVWFEQHGELRRSDIHLDGRAIERIIDRLLSQGNGRVDRASPLVDLRLADGSRANIVVPPVAIDGPCITIRRFALRDSSLGDFGARAVVESLSKAVQERRGIVVFGGTGSGKTTLLNALAGQVSATERIVTIEETAELRLRHAHVVRLEARPANSDGAGSVTVRQLVRNALRMRPDRIVVGEVRGLEVLDMAQAMNTGHAGSMTTCHANSPRDVLRRLEAMAMFGGDLPLGFVRSQLAAGIGVLVEVRRGTGGHRFVNSVVAVSPDADWSSGTGLTPLCAQVLP